MVFYLDSFEILKLNSIIKKLKKFKNSNSRTYSSSNILGSGEPLHRLHVVLAKVSRVPFFIFNF